MATLTDYKGLQVVDPDPTGDGGLAIQDDFKQLVDWHPRSEWAQSASPTANDDEGDDFYPGSHWLRTNTSPSQLFVCQSSAAAAAVWVQLVTPDMDVQFGTVNVTNNLLIGTTSNVTANGTAVLVFGSNGGTDPTFAANTWGLWMDSSTMKTNANVLHMRPTGANTNVNMTLERSGSGVAQWRFYTGNVRRWIVGMPNGSDEGGGNSGGDLQFYCYSDADGLIANPLTIVRANGIATFNTRAAFTKGTSTGVTAKTAAYTLTDSDSVVVCDATSAAFTVTLPSAASFPGRLYTIKRINGGSNNVTVGTTSSQTIDGTTTQVLTTQYETIRVVSNGSNWWKI